MNVTQLKDELRSRDLSVSGRKQDLIERLNDYDVNESAKRRKTLHIANPGKEEEDPIIEDLIAEKLEQLKQLEQAQVEQDLRVCNAFSEDLINGLKLNNVHIEKTPSEIVNLISEATGGSLLKSAIVEEQAPEWEDEFKGKMDELKKTHRDVISICNENGETLNDRDQRIQLYRLLGAFEAEKTKIDDYDKIYLINWIRYTLLLSLQETNPIDASDHLEAWWDINWFGHLVDACFLNGYKKFQWRRKESVSQSVKSQRQGRIYKMDGILVRKPIEVMVLESQLPGDTAHEEEDTKKIAKALRCMLDEAFFNEQLLGALKAIPFYGIRTSGSFIIYRLDRKYSSAYRFGTVFQQKRAILPCDDPGNIESIIDMGIAMLAMKNHIKDACLQFMGLTMNKVPCSLTNGDSTFLDKLVNKHYQTDHVSMEKYTPLKPSKPILGAKLKEKVAEGELSDVYSAIRIVDGSEVIIKIPKEPNLNEVRILTMQKGNPNIVPLLDFTPVSNMVLASPKYTLMFPRLSPIHHGDDVERVNLSLPLIVVLMENLLNALVALDKQNVIHMDVKPQNIMWNASMKHFQLIDFDLAMICDGQHSALSQSNRATGTVGYMAPEILHSHGIISHKCDVFSAGIVLGFLIEHHLLSIQCLADIIKSQRKRDFFGNPYYQSEETFWRICGELKQASKSKKCPAQLQKAIDLLCLMTNADTTHRPTAQKALEHSFFQATVIKQFQEHKKIPLRDATNIEHSRIISNV